MTRFKRLIVENYKSIHYGELNFQSGIYKVIGMNEDNTYTSNGAGKSSVLQAIVLGLYNRDFTGATLDTLSNRFTGKPYNITVEFDTVLDGKLVEVVVTNPAGASRMRVTVNGENAATGSIVAVPLIEKMLGMGYITFKVTHFITSSTITNLTENLSQPTLFNDILHIVELQELDKKLLSISKELGKDLEDAKSKLQELEQQEKLLDFKSKYDISTIKGELEITESQLTRLDATYSAKLNELSEISSNSTSEVIKLQQLLDQTKETLRDGICSMCGSILIDKTHLQTMNSSIEQYKEDYRIKKEELDSINKNLSALKKKYSDSRDAYLNTISTLKQDFNIAKEVATLKVSDSDIGIKDLVEDLEEQSLFVATARKEIKSGKVIKNVLDQFFSIVLAKLREYSTLIRLDHFDVSITNDRLGMAILLKQNGIDVPIETLSNGEKTRLSLLVLISMLDAMKTVSESETNLVILDEAASSFDKSGIEELSQLFSHLKYLGQAIFIITHGSEMDEVAYDYQLAITKSQGLATTLITEL